MFDPMSIHYAPLSVFPRDQIIAIQKLLLWQELLHSLIDKLETFPELISNEVSVCISHNLWICFHVYGS